MKERKPRAAASANVAEAIKRRRKKSRIDSPGRILPGIRIGAVAGAIAVLFSFISLIFMFSAFFPRGMDQPRAVTPIPLPKVMDLPQFQGEHRERLYWGTYRPHLYLGVRSRTPKSLLAGLMWIGVQDGHYALRHTCEDSDGLKRYGWVRHDGISYGRQEILDHELNITTSFLKSWNEGSGYGGDWSVSVNVEDNSELNVFPNGDLSTFFYIADEEGGSIHITNDSSQPVADGFRNDAGKWEMHLNSESGANYHYAGFRTEHMHNLTQSVQRFLTFQGRNLHLVDAYEKNSNVVVFQITGRSPLRLDVTFLSGVDESKVPVRERVDQLSGARLDNKLAVHEQLFEQRFEETFKLSQAKLSSNSLEVGKAALSNLLGGISYFFGESLIAIPTKDKAYYKEHHWTYWPAALFSAVPSRSFFPRGFLWDEGFHQIIISKWDRNLTYDIIGHWLDLINIDGWIPREQILGAEARVRVPEEFILQHTDNANPPTLFLPLHDIALASLKAGGNVTEEKAFLEKTFPRLEAWFEWFNRTQAGRLPGAYYWHGRAVTDKELNAKSLSSGLDDYPRASHPSPDERHVDLRCWMALAAKSMAMIAKIIGVPHEKYEETANHLTNFNVLNKLHYDQKRGRYYDYGNHTEKVSLQWENSFDPVTGHTQQVLRRVVSASPKLQLVPHFGYVSLFPFIMKIIPSDSDVLKTHLELIQTEKLLWTDYGLRSLATTSSMYNRRNTEHDPPYWRGPVWMNINYLVLSSLHYYSQEPGPHKDTAASIYKELRQNLIRNVVQRYDEMGYLFEQYDNAKQGEGKGARPFTGWTSLILLVMAEQYQH